MTTIALYVSIGFMTGMVVAKHFTLVPESKIASFGLGNSVDRSLGEKIGNFVLLWNQVGGKCKIRTSGFLNRSRNVLLLVSKKFWQIFRLKTEGIMRERKIGESGTMSLFLRIVTEHKRTIRSDK